VGQGTGLGLAIVYGVVSAQGGEVRVESEPGNGARFVTTWPVAERPRAGG
jgi:signal transduction histidine kinase